MKSLDPLAFTHGRGGRGANQTRLRADRSAGVGSGDAVALGATDGDAVALGATDIVGGSLDAVRCDGDELVPHEDASNRTLASAARGRRRRTPLLMEGAYPDLYLARRACRWRLIRSVAVQPMSRQPPTAVAQLRTMLPADCGMTAALGETWSSVGSKGRIAPHRDDGLQRLVRVSAIEDSTHSAALPL